MSELTLDLSGAGRYEAYSAETLDKARDTLREHDKVGDTVQQLGNGVYIVTSIRSRFQRYRAAVSLDSEGHPVGVTCTCENGRKGGIRARCYHAAVAEYLADPESFQEDLR